jgi:hypothetical protein
VDVFELLYNGFAILRRVPDGFVNATNMLTLAGPSRTKAQLAKRDQIIFSATHEKVNASSKLKGVWCVMAIDNVLGWC